MFAVLLRASITFIVAPFLIYFWMQGMGPLIDVIDGFGVEESSHASWLTSTVEWLPLIVLLSLIIWIIAAAVTQRNSVGV